MVFNLQFFCSISTKKYSLQVPIFYNHCFYWYLQVIDNRLQKITYKNFWLDEKIKFIFSLQKIIHQQQNILKIQLHIEAKIGLVQKGLLLIPVCMLLNHKFIKTN